MINFFRKKYGFLQVKLKSYLLVLALILPLSLSISPAQAAFLDVEAHGVYGGFWRDLYKFGPVVIDTVGADLGIFVTDNFKMGASFATVVGILSHDPNDDIFGSIDNSFSQYNAVAALDPADFSYSTIALKLEYLLYDGDTYAWSTTGNFGVGLVAYNPGLDEPTSTTFSHGYSSIGTAIIFKLTNNIRMSLGISYRNDRDANDPGRPVGFENFDAVTIYNHLYMVKF